MGHGFVSRLANQYTTEMQALTLKERCCSRRPATVSSQAMMVRVRAARSGELESVIPVISCLITAASSVSLLMTLGQGEIDERLGEAMRAREGQKRWMRSVTEEKVTGVNGWQKAVGKGEKDYMW